MSRVIRFVIAFVLGFSPLAIVVPVQAGTAAQASTGRAAVRILRYDAGHAAEFRSTVDQAAQIWNSSVTDVRLVAGHPADFVVLADDGWPRAQLTDLGRGTVWMGRQATTEGHDPLRIATHEIGHILGLPDRRTGLCEDLMSGASAGTGCTNPYPNTAEKAEVEGNFRGFAPAAGFGRTYVDDLESTTP
ncbi:snapalysin family zinc-dependent metalloprotease [Streptosporangium sp. NPDC004631]